MRDRHKMLIGAGVVVVVAAVALWFVQTHERQEVEVDAPPEPEARFNPYLALEDYLRALEIDVEVVEDAGRVDEIDETDLVVLSSEVAAWEPWWRRPTDGWINEGGHLVVLVGDHGEGAEALERYEDLNLVEHDVADFDADREDVHRYDYDGHPLEFEKTLREFVDEQDDEDEPVETFRGPIDPDFVAVNDEGRPLVSSRARGDGRLTVVADEWLWTNQGLEHGEMGLLIADVLAADGDWPTDAIAFVESSDWGWLGTVFKRGWPVLAGLLVLLGFALTRARRFGPPIPTGDDRRRRRVDHIRATGRFLWDHGAREVLVESSREALIQKLRRRRPSLQTMTDRRRLEIMAEELQTTSEDVERLLEGPIPRSRSDFQSLIAELERQRRNL